MGMLGVTSYTKKFLRAATVMGVAMFFICLAGILTTIILDVFVSSLPIGHLTYLLEGLFVFLSVILFFIGFAGEYIMFTNQRSMQRPLVCEEKRINFDEDEKN